MVMAPDWSPPSPASAFLANAVIEVDEDGATFVFVDGEPLFAYPSVEGFLDSWGLRDADVERAPTSLSTA